MECCIIPLVAAAALAACIYLIKFLLTHRKNEAKPRPQPNHKTPSYKAVPLLTPTEEVFYLALIEATSPEHAIIAKVRLADLIAPDVQKNHKNYMWQFNRISAKHVDFVICDFYTLSPLVVIELDDASHNQRRRKQRDQFVDAALKQARIPILHAPVQNEYKPEIVAKNIQPYLTASPTGNDGSTTRNTK